MKLSTGFLRARENSWFIRTTLVLDAHDLNLQAPETNRSTVIRLVVRAYNLAGEQTIGGVDQELRVSLDRDGYEHAMKWVLVYQTIIPVDKDGPYQVRALCKGEGFSALGTAGESLVISLIANEQVAMRVYFSPQADATKTPCRRLIPLASNPERMLRSDFNSSTAKRRQRICGASVTANSSSKTRARLWSPRRPRRLVTSKKGPARYRQRYSGRIRPASNRK